MSSDMENVYEWIEEESDKPGCKVITRPNSYVIREGEPALIIKVGKTTVTIIPRTRTTEAQRKERDRLIAEAALKCILSGMKNSDISTGR